jgi:NhaA family Na+:H+ antiporter
VFLTALAIADDLGAVLVIAVFYTASIDLHALGAAITLLIVLLLFNCVGLRNPLSYVLVGTPLWYALLHPASTRPSPAFFWQP